jgi:outer membrane protein assembly factor BamB
MISCCGPVKLVPTMLENSLKINATANLGIAVVLMLAPVDAQSADWLQFGFDPSHSGNNLPENTINVSNVGTLVQIYSVTLPSISNAAPVFLSNVSTPNGIKDLLFIVSSDGHLFAIDASNGAVVWSRQPPPVGPGEDASPAIDPNRKFVYAYGLDGYVHKYAVGDGTEISSSQWPIVSTLKPNVEHGASALAIGTPPGGPNYLYSATNGFNGDNGDYQGHVTTINLETGASSVFNANCSNLPMHLTEGGMAGIDDCGTPRSGIWGRPGAVYDSATNRMYVTTANGNFNANVGGFNWGDSVLALPPSGAGDDLGNPIDSYTPSNFLDLDLDDIDLGSGALAILPVQPNSIFPHLGVVMGKDTIVRLLNLDDMSGNHGFGFVGGELQALSEGQIYDTATAQPTVWVNSRVDGSTWIFEAPAEVLVALELAVDSSGIPSLTQRWISHSNSFSSSSIIANDVLYAMGRGGLQAMDPISGSILWSSPSDTACCGWGSPILVNGRLYVNGSGTLAAFALDSIFKNGFESNR